MVLGHIAHALVSRGYRVLLFDLFGRGFSDGVGDIPHDNRLYTTQILLALASSPIPWTGTNSFRLIGYSLGGAIAASFAVHFPQMISSLVLLAPAGLIREKDLGFAAWLIFKSGFIPKYIARALIRRRLQSPWDESNIVKTDEEASSAVTIPDAIQQSQNASSTLAQENGDQVHWMATHHDGFVPAFLSCAQYAPFTNEHETWRTLGRQRKGSVAVMIGKDDKIVNHKIYEDSGLPLLGGRSNVFWRVLPGTHDFVMTHSEIIMQELDTFWES